ncbi:MAG: threonine synthase [Firmicutes bacterium]|nr:threonine synthase [Bacillota bacterium]
MKLQYKSTRGGNLVDSSFAIVKGIAKDGGLYVPTEIPKINKPLKDLTNKNYKELAFYIMNKFLPDFNDEELLDCVEKAYNQKFDTEVIAPLIEKDDAYFLELFHGPTLAFKDMALSILPHLLKASKKKLNIKDEIVILTATSGDTGKAALEGFSDVEGTKIIVFFPKEGVSKIQERQMITQRGENTHVIGINGNFDDAQNAVKKVFNDKSFNDILKENDHMFSSANSINIGRLIPQIVYYFYSYLNLLKNNKIDNNEKINIVVPTGNFGNILAAYYAKKMGLPVNKLICASNENNVLYDFLNTGIYDMRRDLKLTSSPSMDILISSNLERFLYELSNRDSKLINSLMKQLNNLGVYEITDEMKKGLNDFYGGYADEEKTFDTIKKVFNKYNYLIDPHTAVAYSVYKDYKKETSDDTKTIIASTASPYKFTKTVYNSINDNKIDDDFKLIEKLSKYTNTSIPKVLKSIDKDEILHKDVCNVEDIKKVIEKILKV